MNAELIAFVAFEARLDGPVTATTAVFSSADISVFTRPETLNDQVDELVRSYVTELSLNIVRTRRQSYVREYRRDRDE